MFQFSQHTLNLPLGLQRPLSDTQNNKNTSSFVILDRRNGALQPQW